MRHLLFFACIYFTSISAFAQFQDDFSLYTNQADADAAWPSANHTKNNVNIALDQIDVDGNEVNSTTDNHTIVHDLGVGNVDGTAWVLRFRFRWNTFAVVNYITVGLSSQDGTINNPGVPHSYILAGIEMRTDFANSMNLFANDGNNGISGAIGGDGQAASTPAWNTTDDNYIEIIRDGNSYTVNRFSDAAYSNLLNTAGGTVDAGVANLRYITISHEWGSPRGNNVSLGEVGCVQFCNGVNTFSCSNTITCGGELSLPVESLVFQANWTVNTYTKAELIWETEGEYNNDYFQIERSLDAINFESILAPISSSGNSADTYSTFDESPHSDVVSYYRVKQVDYDGSFSYSNVDALNIPEGIDIIHLYGNPVSSNLSFLLLSSLDTDIYLNIVNALGQLIKQQTQSIKKGTTTINMDVEELASGNYYIEVIASGKYRAQRKFVVNPK